MNILYRKIIVAAIFVIAAAIAVVWLIGSVRKTEVSIAVDDRINITPRTLQKLFNKASIDTQQLLAISRALGVDLFRHYSDTLDTHAQSGHMSTSDTQRME